MIVYIQNWGGKYTEPVRKSNSSESIRKKKADAPTFPVAQQLLDWYDRYRRDLPWRASHDPYRVWLSEIMLQQTRVNQAINYYYRFLEAFPTLPDLARAPEQEVLRLWQGLGYYSRARNLHAAAGQVMEKHAGRFPSDIGQIRQLRGIGVYTSAAIGSICFRIPLPAVDGNALRVIARFYGLTVPVNTPAGFRAVTARMEEIIDPARPGDFNQAVMELGAGPCAPRQPRCHECPLQSACVAFQGELAHQIPVRQPKKPPVLQEICYLVLRCKDTLYMRRRGTDAIWAGMFDFPQWTAEDGKHSPVPDAADIHQLTGIPPRSLRISAPLTHLLTHRRLHISFVYATLPRAWKAPPADVQAIRLDEMHTLPVPVPIAHCLRKVME